MITRAIGLLAGVSLLFGALLVVPASAQAALRVSASVAGGPYVVGNQESIPVTLTVTNAGTEERRVWGRVRTVEGSPFQVRYHTWGDLDPSGAGAVLAPGQTRTYDLIGHVDEWAGQPRVVIGVWRPTPNIPEVAETEFAFALVPGDRTDAVGGSLFTDANENRTADPGEELAGVTVHLVRDFSSIREAVSGADGRFAFTDVPVGYYELRYGPAPDGWLLPYNTTMRVDGTGGTTDLRVRARRPVSESLRASVALDRDTYAAGDTARLTVTLTNTGRYPLTGLYAGCDRLGTQFHLLVHHEAWGELTYGGPGATVQPGETRVFPVVGTVPGRADHFGVVSVVCDFVDDEAYLPGAAQAQPLYARVSGGRTADTSGTVFHDEDHDYTVDEGEALAGTRVGLRDVITGRLTAVATTDDAGRLEYDDVPVGRYTAHVFGPWTPLHGVVQVAADPHSVPFGALLVEPRHNG